MMSRNCFWNIDGIKIVDLLLGAGAASPIKEHLQMVNSDFKPLRSIPVSHSHMTTDMTTVTHYDQCTDLSHSRILRCIIHTHGFSVQSVLSYITLTKALFSLRRPH